MKKEDALRFLIENQPMPDDEHLSHERIQVYDEVRRFFLLHPDEASIPLFLNSFGNRDGHGVYQLVEDVIRLHPDKAVIPHLVRSLSTTTRPIQYWCTQISANFPHPDLIKPLVRILQTGDFDMKYAAITALEQIHGERAKSALRNALSTETDEELRELLRDALTE